MWLYLAIIYVYILDRSQFLSIYVVKHQLRTFWSLDLQLLIHCTENTKNGYRLNTNQVRNWGVNGAKG